ncbi:MAG: sodium-translocating pyrophosphatase [Candidatus Odinarchaeia archaeon]
MAEELLIIAPIAGIVGIIVTVMIIKWLQKQEKGTPKMIEIHEAIKTGANAYLRRQYKTIFSIGAVIAVILFAVFDLPYLLDPSLGVPFFPYASLAFMLGVAMSLLSGYIGMYASTMANVRVTYAARQGIAKSIKIGFYGGLVTGLAVISFSLLGIYSLWMLYRFINGFSSFGRYSLDLLFGYAFGASFAALFAQVGGGIYTKAADVGADLVGKVEAGIPEDDPRNPAVIADNVGDNVGDCAGRGADLFESAVAENIGSMIIGVALYLATGIFEFVIFTLAARGIGIFAALIGALVVKGKEGQNPMTPLRKGLIVTGIVTAAGFGILTPIMLGGAWYLLWLSAIIGIICAIVVDLITEYYTARDHRPVNEMVAASRTGAATNIISGFSVSLEATALPTIVFIITILGSFFLGYFYADSYPALLSMYGPEYGRYITGIFGTAIATTGILSTTSIVLALDTFGPIVDNAAGIAEMSDADKEIRSAMDRLDMVGNTTKALTKGFAMASAAVAAFLLFQAYLETVEIIRNPGVTPTTIPIINIAEPVIAIGLFVGAMLPFLFSAFAIKAAGKSASAMIEEVRRQFKEIPGIMEGTGKPDYARCVDISTKSSLKQMVAPGVIATAGPIITGLIFGADAVGAMLMSATVVGIMLALMMNIGGGAYDNAKKQIEAGAEGGKGSPAHAAAVVGDTFGDPLKDTAGPSLHILIKLFNTISLLFAIVFVTISLL